MNLRLKDYLACPLNNLDGACHEGLHEQLHVGLGELCSRRRFLVREPDLERRAALGAAKPSSQLLTPCSSTNVMGAEFRSAIAVRSAARTAYCRRPPPW